MTSGASLYLDFEISAAPDARTTPVLAAALEAAPLAAVLIRPAAGNILEAESVKPLIALVQQKSIAALVGADAGSATGLGADGIHVSWSPDVLRTYSEARRNAPPSLIIGAEAGKTRHDAMELGEAGADYIAFAIPPHVEDRARAAERRLDLIGWWSEIFEVPCVALDVADAEAAAVLAEAGADFIAVTVTSKVPAAESARHVATFADALRLRERAQT